MRVAVGMVVLGAAFALGGCGSSERDRVQAKVEQFVKATAGKDYKTICDQVLAPSLLGRLAASGIGCEQAMQIALGGVQSPTLSVGQITVNGRSATAVTLSGAKGQQASLDAIGLIKTADGWRVFSLGSPVVGHASASK